MTMQTAVLEHLGCMCVLSVLFYWGTADIDYVLGAILISIEYF